MKTKLLALVLTLAMLVGMTTFLTVSAETRDGASATGFAGGDGTEATPYLISNAAEWAYFAAQVTAGTTYSGKYVKLTADVTFNEGEASTWATAAPANAVPTVGTDGKPFKGTFDGQGHTLSGVYINGGKNDGTGLFGEANGATIQNLVIENSAVIAEDWSGILIGEVSGGITVKNVFLASDTYLTVTRGAGGTACAGGFAGGCYGSTFSSPVKIEDSVFAGTVELTGNADKGYIGGFVGNGNTASGKVHDIVLTNCLMTGKILSSKSFSSGFVGGNGDTKGKFSDTAVTMTGCVYLAGEAGHNAADSNSYPLFNTVKNGASASGCYSDMSGNQYKVTESGSKAGVSAVTVFDLIGTNAAVTITGWTKRAGDIMLPAGVAEMMKDEQFFTVALRDGASVRLDVPTGLRFNAVISKTFLADFTNVTGYGIIIAPTQYVEAAGTFTMEALDALTSVTGDKYVKIEATAKLTDNEEFAEFTGVLLNVKPEHYEAGFSAIAYVEADGEVFYSAYNAEKNSRTIAGVAEAAYGDTSDTETAEYAYLIEGDTKYSPYTTAQRAVLAGFFTKGE